jgi:hypothetical protein
LRLGGDGHRSDEPDATQQTTNNEQLHTSSS